MNCEVLTEALEKAGVRHIYRHYPNVKHGAGLAKGTAAESWFEEAVRFWESCME